MYKHEVEKVRDVILQSGLFGEIRRWALDLLQEQWDVAEDTPELADGLYLLEYDGYIRTYFVRNNIAFSNWPDEGRGGALITDIVGRWKRVGDLPK